MEIISELKNKDDKEAYALLKTIAIASVESDYYYYFDKFVDLINHESSYVRTRVMLCIKF